MDKLHRKRDKRAEFSDLQKAQGLMRPGYVIFPVLLGLIVIGTMFFSEYKDFDVSLIKITNQSIFYFALAWLCMVGRDFGLTWRFRSLTDHDITWGQALRVNMLCEFTSAVTPSTVGGSSFGMIYLKGEGLRLGRATTIMMTTLFLDELFFVVACPIGMMLIPFEELFASTNLKFAQTLRFTFWLVYVGLVLWTLVLFMGLFVKPQFMKALFRKVFSLKFLRKWKEAALEMGDNFIATSVELKQKKLWWWIRAFFATALSWISRYLVVNALFLAFAVDADQLLVLLRQLVVWVVLTISPTPGGSGLSEWIFTKYYGDMIANTSLAVIMALCWRFISYYIYLIIGVLVIPSWLRGWKRRIRMQKLEKTNENGDN
jgi:uncharacterized protein (TIRG00374 family)